MQRMHWDHKFHHHHLHFTILSKTRLVEIGLISIAIALFATYAIQASLRMSRLPVAPLNTNPSAVGTAPTGLPNTAPDAGKRAPKSSPLEQDAHRLAALDTPEAYRTLLQGLKQTEAADHRDITLALLKNVSPAVVPILMDALDDSDIGVRAGAIQALGMRHTYQAIPAITQATYDPVAQVRTEAVLALGELYAWQALPRLEQLQVNEDSLEVREAAQYAEMMIKVDIAKELGLPDHRIIDVSVTNAEHPRLYAVTANVLYRRQGKTWDQVSQLPGAPLDLAAGNVIYLATANTGVYHSLDGGVTWQHLQFGMHTPTQLTMSAIVIDPRNPRQLYAALIASGAAPGKFDPLSIVSSNDAGNTWVTLRDSRMSAITTRLVLDPFAPTYLFGIANETPWRYSLSK